MIWQETMPGHWVYGGLDAEWVALEHCQSKFPGNNNPRLYRWWDHISVMHPFNADSLEEAQAVALVLSKMDK